MRPTHGDTIADDFELETIVIPNAGGALIQSLRGAAKPYEDRIMGWEIIDNDDDFEVAKVVGMDPKTSPGAAAGFAPPVAKTALDTTFVKAAGGADVNAVLVLYIASIPVNIRREATPNI